MGSFVKGLDLCEGFFRDCAQEIIESCAPGLPYSAGLVGYGSDVLGFDDPVSTDHMWGPRFYLFLSRDGIARKDALFQALCEKLPCTYRGYSVNFTAPDPNDNGVQHPAPVTEGPVNPLIFIQTFEDFLTEQLGTSDLDHITPLEWLAFSEHRLLSLVSGTFFVDGLRCAEKIGKIRFYPRDVKLYLIASNWELIAAEQAFVKRCGDCGDDTGSRILCTRLCERLMRLYFLYRDAYAPYSKWFGTAFDRLARGSRLQQSIRAALSAECLSDREDSLLDAQVCLADLHNASGLTAPVDYRVERYFGRDIKVIFADKFAEAASRELTGSPLENAPRFGSMSQIGGVASLADGGGYDRQIMWLYELK